MIIGGMVLDIHATPSIPANPRTTTLGKANYVLGGVARNVAECMSKLGAKPYMISALGLDMVGNILLEHWKSAGLSIKDWVIGYRLECCCYMAGIKVQLEDAGLLHMSWTNSWSVAGYVAGIRVLLEDWIAIGSFTASLVIGIL
ncbi:hypothetical protein CUMW_172110 [Citrus unshiu]|uniref:Carbohydrate kinase PfkB domain-containing protein n=1 Tax=Citrus unshiu TaxID=55188 RepID=A0A2H5PWM5_CITUN|nr:hypothetical protein CUMW_172110 [Citrus unshiu]